MLIVLKHLRNLLFLIIFINSFFSKLVYSQNDTILYSKQDIILIEYFNSWAEQKIEYIRNDTIQNILNFNLGALYDTTWYESSRTVDSAGIVTTFDIIKGSLDYRRVVSFQRINQSLYIGLATNIFNAITSLSNNAEFQIFFFIFNSNEKKMYQFLNLSRNIIEKDVVLIRKTIDETIGCYVHNNHYYNIEIITFNKRQPYGDYWGYFDTKSEYIIYEKFITLFGKKIKLSEKKKQQKIYLQNCTDIDRLKKYFNFIIEQP